MKLNLTLWGFIKKELSQTLRDPRMRTMLFVAPVMQMTLFGYALSTEVRNLRLAGVYQPSDAYARSLETRLYASGLFKPAKIGDSDPYQAVYSGKADAVFVVPPEGLKASMARGQGQIQLLVDATNSTRAQSVENYFNAVMNDQLKDLKIIPADQPHLALSVRMLYNPAMETSYFMVPGVLAMLLVLVTMTLTSSSITREKEMGTFETLIAAPVEKWEIIVGKTLPYVLIGVADIPIVMLFATQIFHVPIRGPLWQLGLGGLVFVCAGVGIGTLISTVAKNQQQAMMAGFLVVFPAQMLSGLMYPLENMPKSIVWISYFNPLKYFVTIMRSVTLKGGDPVVFWMNLWPMALIAAFAILFAFRRFHQRLN